jgi:hypothetical protein
MERIIRGKKQKTESRPANGLAARSGRRAKGKEEDTDKAEEME